MRIDAVGEAPHIAGGTAVDLDTATSPRVIVMLEIHVCRLMIPRFFTDLCCPF